MRGSYWLVLIAGCGRVAFDPTTDAQAVDGTADSPLGDLIAYYTMDQIATNGALVDASGHGHSGSCQLTACPITEPGVWATALRFDGIDDLITVPSTAELQGLTAYTVAFWARFDPPPQIFAACMVSKAVGTAEGNTFQLCATPTNEIFFSSWDGVTNQEVTATPTLDLAWHHLALVWDGATETFYFDGVASDITPRSKLFDGGPLAIGADIDMGSLGIAFFPGWLDEIRIYNRALSASELITLAVPPS